MKKLLFFLPVLAMLGLASFDLDSQAATRSHPKQKAHTTKKVSHKPFINGHYVLGPTMKVNGYHSREP